MILSLPGFSVSYDFLRPVDVTTNRCMQMNSNSNKPVAIFPHHERRFPLKVISAGITDFSSTPKRVPIM